MHTKFWSENLREETGCIWLRRGTSDNLLWTWQWTFRFHKRHGISWL